MSQILRVTGIHFCSAHRIQNHPGKCRNLHGHNYAVEVEVQYPESLVHPELGYWMDFSELKGKVQEYVDTRWDHGTILQNNDPLASPVEHDGSKLFLMQVPPTAENISKRLSTVVFDIVYEVISRERDYRMHQLVDLLKEVSATVAVQETAKCTARTEIEFLRTAIARKLVVLEGGYPVD